MHQHLQEHQDDTDDDHKADDESISSNSTSRNRRSERKSKHNRSRSFNFLRRGGSVWSGFQGFQTGCCFKQHDKHKKEFNDMKDYLFIDCDSTLKATISNPDFVTDVKVSSNPVAMATNAGDKKLNVQANLPGYCSNGEQS